MVVASTLSVERGHLRARDAQRIEELLKKLTLPTRVEFDEEEVIDALRKDKKREQTDIHFVLLDRIGHAVVEDIPIRELEDVPSDLCPSPADYA
jgi:3-dehydroquinate synthase